jgi:hypothetical protein
MDESQVPSRANVSDAPDLITIVGRRDDQARLLKAWPAVNLTPGLETVRLPKVFKPNESPGTENPGLIVRLTIRCPKGLGDKLITKLTELSVSLEMVGEVSFKPIYNFIQDR